MIEIAGKIGSDGELSCRTMVLRIGEASGITIKSSAKSSPTGAGREQGADAPQVSNSRKRGRLISK